MATKNKTIKFISALLIVSMITPAILFSKPKQAEALSSTGGGADTVLGAAVCKGAGFLGAGIGGAVGGATSNLVDLNTSVPVNDSVARGFLGTIAQTTSEDTCIHTWENVFVYVIKETLKLAARRLLAKMTQATINWINEDFHGAPLFLENPKSFFRDIAKSEVRNMVDAIGYDTLRFPFGRQTALNIIASYKRQFRDNAEYTLSKVIDDADFLYRYQNDFDFGGWNGFLINTQYPQNNYLGFKMITEQNLASRVEGTMVPPAEIIKDTLQQGMGFLSPQTCPSNPKYNNVFNEFRRPSFQYPPFDTSAAPCPNCTDSEQQDADNEAWKIYNEERDAERAKWAEANTCPGGLVNTTPGSVAANQVMMALGSPLRSLELDAALGNSVAAIFDALINHFFEKGLNALADFVNPQPSFDDNWSYYGNTLGDDGNNNTNRDLGIPTHVSVRVGETTSVRIPARDYSIQSQSDESVATAEIDVSSSSGNKLIVKGLKSAPGANTNIVTIQYSSDPTQTFLLTITVGEIGDLLVSPASILTDIGNQVIATISGGEKPYLLKEGPRNNVAIVNIVDNNLIVIGNENGHTSVKIKDSSSSAKTVTVQITIGPNDLTVAPSRIPITVDQAISATIYGGAGHYIVQPQSDESEAVATAGILGDKLNIIGIAPGETIVTVQDSSNENKTADVTITVGDIGNLVVSPASILIDVDDQIIANISGGQKPYKIIKKSFDKTIISAGISEIRLNVIGLNDGDTVIRIKDSSKPIKTISVNVKVGSGGSTIAPPDVSVDIAEVTSVTIPILGGTTPYIVTHNENAGVATAEILPASPTMLTIRGVAPGTTTVTVQDSSDPTKVADIIIETLAP